MYFKLALRNAKRSAFDYLLYIFTMIILICIMCISNCIASFGKLQAGFKTASLPILIVLIMVILADFINTFMLKQRSKELATYVLLGMEKDRLSLLFLFELCFLGTLCLLPGLLLGAWIYWVFFFHIPQDSRLLPFEVLSKGIFQTAAYFVIVQALTALRIKRKICNLEIGSLMNEKRRFRLPDDNKKALWRSVFIISFLSYLLFLCGIAFLPETVMGISIGLISVPMLVSILAFYKWIYAMLSQRRLSGTEALCHGSRLYQIAELTGGTKTGAVLNTVLCICFVFSVMSFVFGTLLLNPAMHILPPAEQQWMGFLQISICIIFLVIYFSALSFLQLIELKRQERHILILHYIGKDPAGIKRMILFQVMMKLILPSVMCFLLLAAAAPFLNGKLNANLPEVMKNSLIRAAGGYISCFLILCLCYFLIISLTLRRNGIYEGSRAG